MICQDEGLASLSSLFPLYREVFSLVSGWVSSVLSLFLLPFLSLQAINASSIFMYLVALKSISDMVFVSFFNIEKRNSPSLSLLEKVVTRTISSASFISRASLLNQATYDLRLSSSHCLICIGACVECLCICPLIKWVMKLLLNSLKVDIEFGLILLNQTRADPFMVVGKARHIISLGMPWRTRESWKIQDGQASISSHHKSPRMASRT